MSQRSVQSAIDTRLATISFDSSRIGYLNTTYEPQAGKSYLKAQLVSQMSKALTLGADRASGIGASGYTQQTDGVLEVAAVWPADAGVDGAYRMQDLILRLFFRGLTLITSDGLMVHFETPSALPARPDNAWLRAPVRCPFWWLETS